MKILCIDDDLNVLKSLRRMFQMAGYEALIASTARAGLMRLTTDGDIYLVISDYQMPQINGVAFLREVRRNWPETGRILLSGHADKPEVSQAVADGVIQRLIDKPWRDDELLAVVAQMLGPPTSGRLFHLSI